MAEEQAQEQEVVQETQEFSGNEQQEIVNNNTETQEQQIDDSKIFEYAAQKLGREVKTWEDFVETKEVEKVVEKIVEKPLDDDDDITSAYKKYKKETGRDFNDFIKLQENVENKSEDLRLSEYMKHKFPHLDEEDIAYKVSKMKAKMTTEEDEYDAEALDRAREAKIEWKMQIAEATQWQKELQNQYKIPVQKPVENTQVNDGSKLFEEGIKAAAQNYKVKLEDFEYEINPSVDKYTTLEKFFENFKDAKGEFSYKDFIEAAEFKLNRDSILKAYKEDLYAKFMDEHVKKMNNAKPIESTEQVDKKYDNFDNFKNTFSLNY